MSLALFDFIPTLGHYEESKEVATIFNKIEGEPIVSHGSENLPAELRTKYYQFLSSGIEFGFRSNKLNHIHFYPRDHEGYCCYDGLVGGFKACDIDEKNSDLIFSGEKTSGGGYDDSLLGYIFRWVKYNFYNYSIRIEFDKNGHARLISILNK
ncbi:hypothetical protein [Oryzomicrobium sp.]|uniref:hypothetical protein n=1 Tax=Oryzomicrobium sp. TaxID=1911578 RepID=UPI0025F61277|nr:hypothetical protein [Oryzomicrobium sp.]MCE1244336.1 hypothetical protein [Oryzomicrobium sp.]